MDPRLVVLRCAVLVSGKQKKFPDISKNLRLKELRLSDEQFLALKVLSCDALISHGYSRSQAFRKVEQVLDELE